MRPEAQPARDRGPRDGELIEVRVSELAQLFDAMDPSPFQARDLDPRAEQFIVDWAKEAPRGSRLALLVQRGWRLPGAGRPDPSAG